MRALLDGDPDRALEHAAAAESIGRRARSFNAELMAFTARMQAHLDRGTAAEQFAGDVSDAAGRGSAADIPAMYLAAPGPGLLLAAGDASHAQAVLRALLAGPARGEAQGRRMAGVPLGAWPTSRSAWTTGRPRSGCAAELAPYESLWAVDGIGAVVFGTVAEQLGRLAAYLGQPDEAGRYLATARDRYERAGAPALRARVDALAVRAATGSPPRR